MRDGDVLFNSHGRGFLEGLELLYGVVVAPIRLAAGLGAGGGCSVPLLISLVLNTPLAALEFLSLGGDAGLDELCSYLL